MEGELDNFAVVPGHNCDTSGNPSIEYIADGNWYAIRPLYLHTVDRLANKFTLAHLKTYNLEAGVPVAPEGRDQDYALSGDKYSNFNAGKILLLLEGIGGEMACR